MGLEISVWFEAKAFCDVCGKTMESEADTVREVRRDLHWFGWRFNRDGTARCGKCRGKRVTRAA